MTCHNVSVAAMLTLLLLLLFVFAVGINSFVSFSESDFYVDSLK